jgi:hypothetical protein
MLSLVKTYMMRTAIFVSLMLCSLAGRAQVKLEEVVKPGTKLIYSVKNDLGTFDFIVTIKDMKGTGFTWVMTAPANMNGEVIHSVKALKDAFKVYSLYQSETKTLDDKSLGIWISKKMFDDLTKGLTAIKVCLNNPLDEPIFMKQFMDGDLVLKVDGNGTKIHDKFVKPARKVKDKWIIDPVNDDFFTYYNSAAFPIIMRLHNGFMTMTLKEVKTAG